MAGAEPQQERPGFLQRIRLELGTRPPEHKLPNINIESTSHHADVSPKSMSLAKLKQITENFSNEIGRGTYGVVYKGRLDGKTIAVKVLKTTWAGERYGEHIFKGDFERLLTLRHPNIIQLVGYCYEIDKEFVNSLGNFYDAICTALCFEHAAHGSLRNYISDADDRLDWHARYKIIKGTLEGLDYIVRHPSGSSISHSDLKPENILLCDDKVPKLAGFGMSELFRNKTTRRDPYVPVPIKSQTPQEHYIFGLGVTIVKIVAGPDAYDEIEDMSRQEFIEAALKRWRGKLERTPIYQSVSEAYCEQVKTCLEIAFKCIDIDRKDGRPKVSEIIDELNKVEDMIPENKSEIDSQQVCERQALELILIDESAEPVMLSYAVLEQATNNFSEMIGSGGFGEVYMGVVQNMKVAVKKLSRIDHFCENQFKDEVTCLMRVKHENIVRFLGYCSDTQQQVVKYDGEHVLADVRQRLLCFEYVPNKSLRDYLEDESHGREWNIRYRLIKGICQGLCYLHEKERITHLDLKPDNILLDHDMIPKITDFGLSRRFGGEQSRIITTNIFGSMGYMAPEYQFKGEVSFKSDIFSLGIIIIKILRGHNHLPDIQNWHESIDIDCPQVRRCIEIAQMCVDEEPNKRPTIDYIIDMLNELETV